jgi:hypothetical protein
MGSQICNLRSHTFEVDYIACNLDSTRSVDCFRTAGSAADGGHVSICLSVFSLDNRGMATVCYSTFDHVQGSHDSQIEHVHRRIRRWMVRLPTRSLCWSSMLPLWF